MTENTGASITATLSTTLGLSGSHANSLIGRLNQEWPVLYPDLEPVLNRWINTQSILACYRLEPHTCVELPYDQADAYLVALLDRATSMLPPADRVVQSGERADSGLAARVLLQLMLPAILRLTRWLRTENDDEHEAEAQAVAAMHEAIVGYPTERRQRCAANLLFDALRLARRHFANDALVRGTRVQPVLLSREPACPDHQEGLLPRPTSASEELLWLLARAVVRGELTRDQATLLVDGTAYGWSRQLARERGISVAAVRQRRRQAVAKLRASLADLRLSSDWFEDRLDAERHDTGRTAAGQQTTRYGRSISTVDRPPEFRQDAS